MTQSDLPQLSLGRYLDLVKRRRWQLIPVSLLGLVVGGLIAFFIPRFYVADTLLEHQMVPGQEGPREDPFREIVTTAGRTIPLAVGEAMRRLGWPEASLSDPYEHAEAEREVAGRVKVYQSNADDSKRSYAQLRVQFKDRDGQRAASFLNTLVAAWIEKRIEEVRKPTERHAAEAQAAAARETRQLTRLIAERQEIEREYDLDAGLDAREQAALAKQRDGAMLEVLKELQERRVELEQADRRLAHERELLATLEPRVEPELGRIDDRLKAIPEARRAFAMAEVYRFQMEQLFHEGTPAWLAAKRSHERAQEFLRLLVPDASIDGDGLVPNPEFEAVRQRVAEAETERAKLHAEVTERENALAQYRSQRLARIEGQAQYEHKLALIEETKLRRDLALDELRDAEARLAALTRDVPVRQPRPATVPPHPTEPNILVVALIGCVLGLGVAIGLILLLDLLQGTFKTVDDVERALPVPVLGGVSYLETDEERVAALRSRRRVSMVAAAAVALVTIVVTIFYVDPTRLPAVVRDLLAMLLGA